jgi:hypothetical protein
MIVKLSVPEQIKIWFRKLLLYPAELRGRVKLNLLDLKQKANLSLLKIHANSFEFLRFPSTSRGKHGENIQGFLP